MGSSSSRYIEVSGECFELPDLRRCITLDKKEPVNCGGYADIYRGIWKKGRVKTEVAIKALRTYHIQDDEQKIKLVKHLCRELSVWQQFQHENLLPLYGVASGFGPTYAMVCPWMDQGNVTDYLRRYDSILRLEQRLMILCDVAAGLQYLHSRPLVHGDLIGSNVLMDSYGRARLTDFGMSQVMLEVQGDPFFASATTSPYRWIAPELYSIHDNDISIISASCDIYSFGSVMLQVLSGKIPYHYTKKEPTVLLRLKSGLRPHRPPEIVLNSHWDLIEQCWADNPADRPVIDVVVRQVKEFYMEADKEHPLTEGQARTEDNLKPEYKGWLCHSQLLTSFSHIFRSQ